MAVSFFHPLRPTLSFDLGQASLRIGLCLCFSYSPWPPCPQGPSSFAHRPPCGTATGPYGVPRAREFGSPASQQGRSMVRAHRVTPAATQVQPDRATPWCGCSVGRRGSALMVTSWSKARHCVACRRAPREARELRHGAYRRPSGTFLALWFAAGGLRAGTGIGKGTRASDEAHYSSLMHSRDRTPSRDYPCCLGGDDLACERDNRHRVVGRCRRPSRWFGC